MTNAADLIKVLEEVQPGDELEKNLVGNLSIYRNDAYVGYVDLMFPETVYFTDDDDDK